MSKAIKITKGLDLHLFGQAKPEVVETTVGEYAVKPRDFVGITPKLLVEQGDRVKAGTPLFFAKGKEQVKFTSPVSGTVKAIERGEKRVVEAIRIVPDNANEYEDFSVCSLSEMSAEQIKDKMLVSGVWTVLRQRPYDVVPSPDTNPKCIVVRGFSSAPLAPDYAITLHGQRAAMQVGIDALRKLTGGKVHLNVHSRLSRTDELLKLENVQINTFEGKHPCGNVSVQIEKTDPLNKGERIWYVDANDLPVIGRLFLEGRYVTDRIVALTGEQVTHPQYYKVKKGASIASLIFNNIKSENVRYISGDILTGKRIDKDGFISAYDNQVTVIPENSRESEFMGWASLSLKKYSFSHCFFSWLEGKNKKYHFDARINGSERAIIMAGEYDKVFPMDIYSEYLIKAILAKDIDKMEQLGIYEVAPEDFALCEFIDTSKLELQKIVREGLDYLRKEMN